MQKLVKGIHNFQTKLFRSHQDLFARLAEGQSPDTLFITCSDSRIVPNLITQTDPGDLFLIRNAGNIVPPYGAANVGGEVATIEYALEALEIKDIVICGHSRCGAMGGLLDPEALQGMEGVAAWLKHCECTRRIIADHYGHLSGEALRTATVAENVLVQLEHLKTHPSVATRVARGGLGLHGWVYKLETGQVFAYDPAVNEFLPIEKVETPPTPPARLVARSI